MVVNQTGAAARRVPDRMTASAVVRPVRNPDVVPRSGRKGGFGGEPPQGFPPGRGRGGTIAEIRQRAHARGRCCYSSASSPETARTRGDERARVIGRSGAAGGLGLSTPLSQVK